MINELSRLFEGYLTSWQAAKAKQIHENIQRILSMRREELFVYVDYLCKRVAKQHQLFRSGFNQSAPITPFPEQCPPYAPVLPREIDVLRFATIEAECRLLTREIYINVRADQKATLAERRPKLNALEQKIKSLIAKQSDQSTTPQRNTDPTQHSLHPQPTQPTQSLHPQPTQPTQTSTPSQSEHPLPKVPELTPIPTIELATPLDIFRKAMSQFIAKQNDPTSGP